MKNNQELDILNYLDFGYYLYFISFKIKTFVYKKLSFKSINSLKS